MTRNLKLFTLFSFVWSVPYAATLSWAIADENKRWPVFWIAYLVFGIGFSIVGRQLGKRDSARGTRQNMRLQYFLAALIPAAIVCLIWEVMFHKHSNTWLNLTVDALIFAAILAIGLLITRRFPIKGMRKEELFK